MATKKSAAPAKQNSKPKMREVPKNPPSKPSKDILVFPNPNPERDYVIQFQVPEFTCHCPLTGQPDFAHFTIDMIADELCVELKSLKLYINKYRDQDVFHEDVVNIIMDDMVKLLDPWEIEITGDFNVCGNIKTVIRATHKKPS